MRFPSKVLSLTVSLTLAATVALVDVSGVTAATISANAKDKFIAGVVAPAQAAQRTYGVPASVSIAQAIEASDWGTSSVAKNAKNYFDTRCSASMTAAQFASLADAQVGKPYVLGAEAAISDADPANSTAPNSSSGCSDAPATGSPIWRPPSTTSPRRSPAHPRWATWCSCATTRPAPTASVTWPC